MGVKLDLGCGRNPKKGYIGLDNYSSRNQFPNGKDCAKEGIIPWDAGLEIPYDGESIEKVYTHHFLEHLANIETLYKVFDEVHRVLVPKGEFEIIVPYAFSNEGMCPGHYLLFTDWWFEKNRVFNKYFGIIYKNLIQTKDYTYLSDRINIPLNEAAKYFNNMVNEIHIIAEKK